MPLNNAGKTFVYFNHSCALSGLQVLSHHLSRKVTKMYEAAQTDRMLTFQVLQFYRESKELDKPWNKVFRNKVEKSAEKYLIRYRSVFLACIRCCLCCCMWYQQFLPYCMLGRIKLLLNRGHAWYVNHACCMSKVFARVEVAYAVLRTCCIPNHGCKSLVMLLVVAHMSWLASSDARTYVTMLKLNT